MRTTSTREMPVRGGTEGHDDPIRWRRSLLLFWTPKYWPTWMLLFWMWTAARLPLRFMIALHKRIGRAFRFLLVRQAQVARRNLELCFPELSSKEISELLSRHFESLGACVGEMGMAWFGSPSRLERLFEVQGKEHLEAALARGRGVILFTGHFTTLEIASPYVKNIAPRFAFMFSRRRNPLLDEMQTRRRLRAAHESFPRDNVRAMLRSLKRNAVVWYASDQSYRGNNSRLIRFFHEPAMTNTAIGRLARLSGACVLPFSYRRRADDSGYVLCFHPPLDGFPSGDEAEDTRRLVAFLEEAIRSCPEQYLWIHKKFKGRPAPLPDVYAQPRPAARPS